MQYAQEAVQLHVWVKFQVQELLLHFWLPDTTFLLI